MRKVPGTLKPCNNQNGSPPWAFTPCRKQEADMKKVLMAISALAILGAVAPANAQGVGVQVGPVGAGVGVGPYYDGYNHRHWRDYGYASDCRVIREHIETPSGRVIFRSRRVCG
jgi:hypothetical protein